jgi:hypothetical protein
MEIDDFVELARTCYVEGTPKYFLAAEKALGVLRAPPPPLIGQFDIQAVGSVGVRRLNKVLQYISYIPLKMAELQYQPLPDKQREIADLFVRCCMPTIVTPSEWIANRDVFLKMIGLTDTCNFGAVLCARQNGKSWTIAVCCAAVMLACEDVEIACYASKQAQAAVIQNYVVQIIKTMGHAVHQQQANNLCWFEHNASAISSMTSFGMNAYVCI